MQCYDITYEKDTKCHVSVILCAYLFNSSLYIIEMKEIFSIKQLYLLSGALKDTRFNIHHGADIFLGTVLLMVTMELKFMKHLM